MKVLITGANGFLGSHLVEQSINLGNETIALVRIGSNLSNLDGINGFELDTIDYTSTSSISRTLEKWKPFDLLVHNAGLTKSYTLDRYVSVNVHITEKLLGALKEIIPSVRFSYISSLAAKGPVGNNGPASNYGRSKLMAEQAVSQSDLVYNIFRPTGIYGQRDVQFVPLIKAVKLGIYPSMTPKSHRMTLINVKDAAKNILHTSMLHTNQTIHLEDGHVYTHDDLKKTLQRILSKNSIKLTVPKPLVSILLGVADLFDRSFNRTPTLSREHYLEISQDWDYDFRDERSQIPLTIDYPLQKGFEDAVAFYREKHLI